MSVGRQGEHLTEFGEVVDAGAVAVTDAGRAVRSSKLMRLALEYAKSFGLPVLAHPEDGGLAAGGVMHEGVVSTRLGLRGKPAIAEEIGAARDLAIAGFTGGRLHLQRVSAGAVAALVRRSRGKGVSVTAEATAHHLLLTHEVVADYGTEYKVDPPLRTAADIEALRGALVDGTIDCIATDHTPCHYDEKEQAFDDAPFGAVGLETTFAVLHTHLVATGVLGLATLIERMSTGPARALGLPGGTLKPGRPADITLLDPRCALDHRPRGVSVEVPQHALRRGEGRGEGGSHSGGRPDRLESGATPVYGCALTSRSSCDLMRPALFGWITRRPAALSIRATATRRRSSASPREPASRTRRIAVRIRDLSWRFRVRAARPSSIRFRALLMLGMFECSERCVFGNLRMCLVSGHER